MLAMGLLLLPMRPSWTSRGAIDGWAGPSLAPYILSVVGLADEVFLSGQRVHPSIIGALVSPSSFDRFTWLCRPRAD